MDCTLCGQALPEREPALCRQCGQPCPDGTAHHDRKITAARAKVKHLRYKLDRLEETLTVATTAANRAEDAATTALKDRDTYDQDHLEPTRATAQQAEKATHGLSRDVAQLKDWLARSDWCGKQQTVIDTAKTQTDKAARDAALTEHQVRRKEIVGRWSELFLIRLQQINPDVETAYIDPTDFTTRVKARNEPDKTFADSSVAGSPKVVTNVAALLSLRDLDRTEPAVRVTPLLSDSGHTPSRSGGGDRGSEGLGAGADAGHRPRRPPGPPRPRHRRPTTALIALTRTWCGRRGSVVPSCSELKDDHRPKWS
ncbi:hypothetical protein [Streptomyces sp. NPDC047097]|uniref:hypothetical protein n=1 Tax=Streptomyces sp. NPDC047097 TaxID=3155260 RepID=UPI0033C29572